MSFITPTRVFSALILGAAILPIVASAEPVGDTNVAVVSTNGLDAAKPADQAKLRHRIAVAAHRLCEQVTQEQSLTSPGYTACFNSAMANASTDGRVVVASAAQ